MATGINFTPLEITTSIQYDFTGNDDNPTRTIKLRKVTLPKHQIPTPYYTNSNEVIDIISPPSSPRENNESSDSDYYPEYSPQYSPYSPTQEYVPYSPTYSPPQSSPDSSPEYIPYSPTYSPPPPQSSPNYTPSQSYSMDLEIPHPDTFVQPKEIEGNPIFQYNGMSDALSIDTMNINEEEEDEDVDMMEDEEVTETPKLTKNDFSSCNKCNSLIKKGETHCVSCYKIQTRCPLCWGYTNINTNCCDICKNE